MIFYFPLNKALGSELLCTVTRIVHRLPLTALKMDFCFIHVGELECTMAHILRLRTFN